MAFQRSVLGQPPALGCLWCGAYAIVRAGRLRRPCRGARTAQQRRCRDALLAERDPVHPHEGMHSVRQPTRGELEWLSRPVLGKRQPGLRDQAAMGSMPDRSDVLRRFGLADPKSCRLGSGGPVGLLGLCKLWAETMKSSVTMKSSGSEGGSRVACCRVGLHARVTQCL